MSESIAQLFENNDSWSEAIKSEDPDFFKKLSEQQTPEYLWIGCADSRVPANQLTGLMPGEVFVHRNIANVVIHTDLNCQSVIQYAVQYLKVKHIIVCGHYGCGGVKAALDNQSLGLIDNWLCHIKEVYRYYQEEIDSCTSDNERFRKLCEKNVVEQVANVCSSATVQKHWADGHKLTVHGLIYDIGDGRLKDLGVSVSCPSKVHGTHKFHI